MRIAVVLAFTAAAAVLAGCGTDDEKTVAPSSTSPASVTSVPVTTAAPPTSMSVATTSRGPDTPEVAQARSAVAALYGQPGEAFLAKVDPVFPLTTADRVNSAAGYAVTVCAARKAGVTKAVINEHIVEDFHTNYSMTITPEQGQGIVTAAWETVCAA